MPDIYDKETRSRVMSRIRGKNTRAEIALRKALWSKGVRGYRIHCKMSGKPDIVFRKKKVIVFVDGDFWHGYTWKVLGKIPPAEYWQDKIQGNIDRDLRYNEQYQSDGWTVVRFWEHEIHSDAEGCAERLRKILESESSTKV